VLLEPDTRVRYRASGGRRGGAPEYPPTALAIDYLLPEGFSGPLSLEIADGKGRVVRTVGSAPARPTQGARAGGGGEQDMRFTGRGRGGGASALPTKGGHNRFMWDYRWSNGVMAAPGPYTAKLTAGDATQSKTFEVQVDPGVLADGTTVADLVAQQEFLIALRATIDDANATRERIEAAMQKAGVEPPPAPGPGESTNEQIAALAKSPAPGAKLQALWARMVTARGTYEQPMLLDQLNSINRVEAGADQKVGAESRERYQDLVKELQAIQSELNTLR
jgi:hypothetical protein